MEKAHFSFNLSILGVHMLLGATWHRNMTYIWNVYLMFLKLYKWKLNVLLGIFISGSAFIIFLFWGFIPAFLMVGKIAIKVMKVVSSKLFMERDSLVVNYHYLLTNDIYISCFYVHDFRQVNQTIYVLLIIMFRLSISLHRV